MSEGIALADANLREIQRLRGLLAAREALTDRQRKELEELRSVRYMAERAVARLDALRAAVASAYELLRTWHDNTHSRNRPPDLNCTGCWIWPPIAILGHALGFDPLKRRDPPAQTTTTSSFALVPAEDERAAVICEQAAARLRRQSIGNAAAERVARAAIDAEREARMG